MNRRSGTCAADAAFQLVALDYALAYAAAFTLSLADARRRSRRWGWWAIGFLLFTAPAIVFYWANPSRTNSVGKSGRGRQAARRTLGASLICQEQQLLQRAKRLSLIPPYLFGEIAKLKAQAIGRRA